MRLYTVAQMRQAEHRAESGYGIPLAHLMDNAGKGLARAALAMCPDGFIGIFCGSGNNGGDGYVCAAQLLRRGRAATVWGVGAQGLTEGLAKNAAEEFLAGGVILPVTTELMAEDVQCGLIIDALLGTGLTRQVSGLYAHVIGLINAAPAPVLACDLPSGVDADSGAIMGTAVRADRTLMMGLAKRACALPPGRECFGQAEVCDIGLPEGLVAGFEPNTIREISPADYPVLEDFLYHAIFLPPGMGPPARKIIFEPEIFVYIKGFGGKDDCGVVAERGGKIVGAAWTRIIPAYGHIDGDTPELAISVLPGYRGQGVGTMMMTRLFELLRARGYRRTSLSVQKDNPAARFYQRLGYVVTGDKLDHAGHEDYIMVKGL